MKYCLCNNMNGPREYHAQRSRSEKDKYYMILLICEVKKNNTDDYTKQTYSQIQKANLESPKGDRTDQEYEINRYKPLYIKQISNKDLVYRMGNYIQHLIIIYNGV